jgi:hypothetical protein
MIDNVAYQDGSGTTAYLQSAKANYYVIGWHPDPNDDPFHLFDQPEPYPTHADRLSAGFIQLSDSSSATATDWIKTPLASVEPTRTTARGARYEVEWDLDNKPTSVPADVIAQSYDDCSPVSVGVNPVDALLAVTHTHAVNIDSHKPTPTTTAVTDAKPDPLGQDILSLPTLIIQQGEDPDCELQGSDTLYTSYFVPADGGQQWHVSGAATSTGAQTLTIPGAQEVQDLSPSTSTKTR